jgi:aryl-alcohol dehydrogenase-like predicted oxidoreductase
MSLQAGARLALGTAQLGQRYGIANRAGMPGQHEAAAILQCARESGIDVVDTAMSYGDSERVIGSVGAGSLRIVTKLPPLPSGASGIAHWVRQQVGASMDRMGIEHLHGLLLHRPSDALQPGAGDLLRALQELRDEGRISRIGVSIYDPSELDALMPRMEVGLVQAPYNVLDRRIVASGWLAKLSEKGVEVHVRSAFLQGLLLLQENELPPAFAARRALWTSWHGWIREQTLTPLQAALGFVLRNTQIDRAVVGVETAAQLRGILAAAKPLQLDVPAELASQDLDLIDASRWKTK